MNKIYISNATIIYANKETIKTKAGEELSLITYIVQESVGKWKQSLIVKCFDKDLKVKLFEKDSKVKIKGQLKVNSYKGENETDYKSSYEVQVMDHKDIEAWVESKKE